MTTSGAAPSLEPRLTVRGVDTPRQPLRGVGGAPLLAQLLAHVLRQALEGELPQRHFGQAVRLEVADGCPDKLAQFLLRQFELTDDDLYRVGGPVNLARMSALVGSRLLVGSDA